MKYWCPPFDESWADCLSGCRLNLQTFSRMQPDQPNPWFIVAMIFGKMISTAGAKEAELQGSSSVMRLNAMIEAVRSET